VKNMSVKKESKESEFQKMISPDGLLGGGGQA
jgi:hypothetical protein